MRHTRSEYLLLEFFLLSHLNLEDEHHCSGALWLSQSDESYRRQTRVLRLRQIVVDIPEERKRTDSLRHASILRELVVAVVEQQD